MASGGSSQGDGPTEHSDVIEAKLVQIPLILSKGGTSLSCSTYDLRNDVPSTPPTPSSGHRSRKEKLVLRSFSTEVDDGMMGFTEPTLFHPDYDDHTPSGRRASRTRRTASAPDSARKLSAATASQARESESSNSVTLGSKDIKPVVPSVNTSSFVVEDVKLEKLEDGSASPIPNRKPKSKEKSITSGASSKIKTITPNSSPRTKTITPKSISKAKIDKDASLGSPKTKTVSPSKVLKLKMSASIEKMRPSPSKTKLKFSPDKRLVSPDKMLGKKNVRRKLDLSCPSFLQDNGSPRKMSPLIRAGISPFSPYKSIVKKPMASMLRRSSVSKKLFMSPEKIKRVERVERVEPKIATPEKLGPAPPPKKKVPWTLKHQFTNVIHRSMKRGSTAKPPVLSPDAIRIETTKTKLPKDALPVLHKKKKKTGDGLDEDDATRERREKDLLHYVVGVACLEKLMEPKDEILPQLFYNMVERLSHCFSNGKENWKQLMDYARNLVSENREEEISSLFDGQRCKILIKSKDGSKKISNLERAFRPVFPITTVIEEKPQVSYPRIAEEELFAYNTLKEAANSGFECGDDEYKSAQLFMKLLEREIDTSIAKSRKIHRIEKDDMPASNGTKPLQKRVKGKVIPVEYEESQNSHGLFIPIEEFPKLVLKSKEQILFELHNRALRNGKTMPLQEIKLSRTKHFTQRNKSPEPDAEAIVSPTKPRDSGKTSPCTRNDDTMKLRNGKLIPYERIDTARLLHPSFKLTIHPEGESDNESGSPIQGTQSGNGYPLRVEATLQQLNMGEDLFSYDPSQSESVSSSNSRKQQPEVGRCVTRGRFPPLPVFNTSSPGLNHWSPPSSPSSSPLSSPLHRDQLSGAEQRMSPSSPSSKKRYSRHRHAKICPPFDNNHCSFEKHFCGYPRAFGSRFCLQHVDEGATMNFDRCKYVKGSRECGRFIPKSQSQSVFCDMHAIAIAKARQKKMKPAKSSDPSALLLKHMRCNLHRVQGARTEPYDHGQFRVKEPICDDEFDALNDSSESDSDDDFGVADYADDQDDNDSDFDEEDEPPGEDELDYGLLKHAGYYTVSEVAEVYRHHLAQLEKLYIREFDCIKREFKYGKREYIKALKRLKQNKKSFTTNPKFLSFDENEFYSESYVQHQIKTRLKTHAYLKNKRVTGRRAVLRLQVMKKRQELLELSRKKAEDPDTDQTPVDMIEEDELDAKFRNRKHKRNRIQICCAINPGGNRCKDKAIPLAKFCRTHINQDQNQKLFSTCNQFFGPDPDDTCKVTVLSELEKFGCPLHNLPIPVKEPPDGDEKKSENEEALEKLFEELDYYPSSSSSSNVSNTSSDDDMLREMEQLVGDELVDMDHYWENVNYLLRKGVDETDSEESDDTDEEESSVPPEPMNL